MTRHTLDAAQEAHCAVGQALLRSAEMPAEVVALLRSALAAGSTVVADLLGDRPLYRHL